MPGGERTVKGLLRRTILFVNPGKRLFLYTFLSGVHFTNKLNSLPSARISS
jgi:hypothetical protein